MAVTIDEFEVEVAPSAAPAPVAAHASAAPNKEANLGQVLEILRERLLRLRAD
jgi:hypothetical protein